MSKEDAAGPDRGQAAGGTEDRQAPVPRRRRHRRVVVMSERDRLRAEAGEDVFAPQVSAPEADAPASGPGLDPHEQDLLREVPPHWFGGRGS